LGHPVQYIHSSSTIHQLPTAAAHNIVFYLDAALIVGTREIFFLEQIQFFADFVN